MMGHSHALSGAAAWLAIGAATPISANVLGIEGAVPVVLGAAVASGAALLPDLDHHSATATRALPPVTNVISKVVETFSGGHRHGTHSIVGIAAATALAYLASLWTWTIPADFGGLPLLGDIWGWVAPGTSIQLGAALYALLLCGLGLTTMKLMPGKKLAWVAAIVGGLMVSVAAPADRWWLPVAVGVGCLAHVIGDSMTTGGVPWLWPWIPKPKIPTPLWQKNGYMGVPVLGATGGAREALFEVALGVYTVAVLAFTTGLIG